MFFWYRLTRVFPDKFHRAVKRLCCVCVSDYCVIVLFFLYFSCYIQCFDALGWSAGRASGLQKTGWWNVGVVKCLGQGTDLHMAQLMTLPVTVSCSTKSSLVLPFWCQLTWVVPDKIQEGREMVVCVCVCVCVHACARVRACVRACVCNILTSLYLH